MLYGSFGTQNLMVTLIFISDPRPGHVRVKNVKFRSSKFSFKNIPILSSFVAGFQNVICFNVRLFEIPKIAFQKGDVITFTWILCHCTAKKEDIGSKLSTLVVGIQLKTINSVLYIFKNSDLVENVFFYCNFDFRDQKPKVKTRENHFAESLI